MFSQTTQNYTLILFIIISVLIVIALIKIIKSMVAKTITLSIVIVGLIFVWIFGKTYIMGITEPILKMFDINIQTESMLPDDEMMQEYHDSLDVPLQ